MKESSITTFFTELASTPPIQMINILPSGAVDLSKLVDPFDWYV